MINKFKILPLLIIVLLFVSCSSTKKKLECSKENGDFIELLFKDSKFTNKISRKIKCSYSKGFISFESSGILEFFPPDTISIKLFSSFGSTVAEMNGIGNQFELNIMNTGRKKINISRFGLDAYSLLAGRPGGVFNGIPEIDSLTCFNNGVKIVSNINTFQDSIKLAVSMTFDANSNLSDLYIDKFKSEMSFSSYFEYNNGTQIPGAITIKTPKEKIYLQLSKPTILNN